MMSNADNDQSRGRELAEKWNIFKKQEGKQSLVAFSLGPQTLFYISTNAAWVFSHSYKSYWIKLIAGKVWEWPISSSHAGLRRVPMQDMFVTRFMDLSGCSTHVVSFWVFALIFSPSKCFWNAGLQKTDERAALLPLEPDVFTSLDTLGLLTLSWQ